VFVAVATHVMQYGNGNVVVFDSHADVGEFGTRLSRLNGSDRFALVLWALGPGMDYDQSVAAGRNREYVQAAGRGDALTVEICKAGGSQWGVDWVRYVIGHPHDSEAPLDVPIVLPRSTEMRSRHEIFESDEAAQLFYNYYKTGDIPFNYALRPEQGFTRDGGNIDLRDRARS
jgi:hypothetical protein